MSVRRAEPGDAVALGAVLSDWIDATVWMPRLHSRDDDRDFVGRLIERCDVWTDDEARGFLARSGQEVTALYVARSARRHGLGRRLLEAAKEGQETLSLWTFQINADAIRFYEREGFREVKRTNGADNDEGLPDVRMMWEAGHVG